MNRILSSKEFLFLEQQTRHIRRMEKKQHIKRSNRTRNFDTTCIAIMAGSN